MRLSELGKIGLSLVSYIFSIRTQRNAKHSSSDHARLNGIIFFTCALVRGGSSSHHPIKPWHLAHRSSVLELLIFTNSIVFELVVHLPQIQSSVQCIAEHHT